ncbi:MAG: tRNA (adenosine(37)-N6)-dimethylallyltransferase MiaA [Patescibacteria group bacterium]|nr:tRNA (adenosine(37)-N6)-dimethylallyltransferase MiaA [Patescibacteria group bacterium]
MIKKSNKLVAVVGPTAGGKTTWSLELAKKFNGEIVNADSRQIYRWMDVGTAKEPGRWRRVGGRRFYEVQGVPHYLIDFLEPNRDFSVAEFQRRAIRRIREIQSRGKLPILVGGTGLYIKAVIDNMKIPKVKANQNLRKSLETKSNEELWSLLGRMDPGALKVVDPQNKRRIIRALEVCILTGKPFSEQRAMGNPIFDALQIGVRVPRPLLYERIDRRVDRMVREGLVQEIQNLLSRNFKWGDPGLSGIGYRQMGCYLRGECELRDAIGFLKKDTRRYSKRQETWFKRDSRVNWLDNYNQAKKLVQEFLQK